MRACCKKGPLLSGKFVRLRLRSRHPKFGGRFGRRAHLFMSICSLCKNFLHLFYFVMFILELRWWCYTFQPPFLCFCKKFLQLFLFMLWNIFLILNNAYYLWLWWVCICNFNLHGLLARAFFVLVFHGCMLNHHNAWPHAHPLIDCSMYVICLCIWSFHHERHICGLEMVTRASILTL